MRHCWGGLAFFLLMALVLSVPAHAAHGPKKILLVQSYHPELEWVAQCERGIVRVFGDRYRVERYYMDTKRLSPQFHQARADEAWGIYWTVNPDLVMLGDDNALRLLGPWLAQTRTPTVYFGINNNPRAYFERLPINMTGVLERLLIFPWIRHLKKIVPDLKRVLVLLDTSPTSDSFLRLTFGNRDIVNVDGVLARRIQARDWAHWQEVVLHEGNADLVILPTFHTLTDEFGDHVEVEEVIRWTVANSEKPVFTHQDYTVGSEGAVGAYVVSGEYHGELAARIANDILEKGKQPSEITPVMEKEGVFYFNQQQLDEFGLVLPEPIQAKAVFR